MLDLKKLQNGSDVRGVAIAGVPGEAVNLTPDVAQRIAAAFGIWLRDRLRKDALTISLGRDSRLSGEMLSHAMTCGLNQIGASVYDFGYATTPSMFMSIVDPDLNVDGALMITASHLPYNRNGIKFFTRDGGTDKSDVADILTIAQNLDLGQCADAQSERIDFLSKYAANLVSFIREDTGSERPFENTHIIVDAGNGCGGFFVTKILQPLGADTAGSLYLNPDGSFPNHIPNPELKNVMDGFMEAVLKSKADLGIIFDTDVDRAAVVDGNGLEINRNRLVALMSAIVLSENPGSTIVTDSITTRELTSFISELGGHHHRFRRGYKNVINEAIRLNADNTPCDLAIETSGHCALRENYFLDDGAYMIVKVLIMFARLRAKGSSISGLISAMKEPAVSEEIRVRISAVDFADYGRQVLADFDDYCRTREGVSFEKPNYEGVRVNFDAAHGDGWALVRMSLHDPVIPINYESESIGGGDVIRKFLLDFIARYSQLKTD